MRAKKQEQEQKYNTHRQKSSKIQLKNMGGRDDKYIYRREREICMVFNATVTIFQLYRGDQCYGRRKPEF
jgi:hypothetical protein